MNINNERLGTFEGVDRAYWTSLRVRRRLKRGNKREVLKWEEPGSFGSHEERHLGESIGSGRRQQSSLFKKRKEIERACITCENEIAGSVEDAQKCSDVSPREKERAGRCRAGKTAIRSSPKKEAI